MTKIKIDKVVSTLPNPLIPDTVYAVRSGLGFDLYFSDTTGAIAHQLNAGSVDRHNDVNISPSSAQDGDSIVIVGGILVRKPRPIIIEKSGWQRTTQDYDSPITDETDPNTNVAVRVTEIFSELGLWKPIISFIGACNSTGANFEADCKINGNTLIKSNPISSKILALEGKDAAGQHPDFSGDATGAGTDNIRAVTLICNTIDITQLSNEIVLTYGCDGSGITASISEITIKFERVYNTTQIT